MVYVADFCGVGEETLSRFNLELIEVDSDDFVIGHCTEAGRRYEVEVTCGTANRSVDANCTCAEAARSAGYCEHVGAFALYLTREMAIRDSPIRDEVLQGLDLEPSKLPDPAEEALALLDQCLAEGVAEATGSEKFRPTETAERVVWRLSIKSGHVQLAPFLQKRKKRGSGWTKGRGLRRDTLREGSYALTPQDLRILSCVKRDYYYDGDIPDVLAALKAMVGYDRVEFNENPVAVRHVSFGIRVVKTSDGKGYALQLENPHSTAFVIDRELIIMQTDAIGIVGECSPSLVQLTKAIGQGSTIVPVERVDELLTRVRALSKAITVHLPTELSAKTENVESKPVMRLISRSDGQLQCGMRVRENDRLFRPGEGVLVRYAQANSAGSNKGTGKTKAKSQTKGKGESNGQVVQYRRDPNSEISNCKSIARQLGLANAEQMTDWDWRFFDFDDSLQFLEAMSTTGEELGVEALWDEESVAPVRVLGAVSAKNLHVELKRKKDWFGIEGGFSLGNQDFTLPELLAAVDSEPAKGYTELRPGMWAKITDRLRQRLAELRDVTHANRSSLEIDVTAMPIIQSLQENELDIKASKEWQESVARLEKSKTLKPVPSKKLKAELRDYQVDGFRWMRRLAEWGVGGCLADDMGLGKTVQTLAVLIDRAKEGPALVIAPTSVGFNWQRETEKFAPSLSAHLYRETERAGFLKGVKKNDIVICSYGLALRDAKALSEIQWGTLVLDEAQFIKNARSKTAQAIRTIPAAWKIALTGTPMENHLGELWSLFRTVSPGLFGSWEQFRKRFASPIERDNNPERQRALSRLIQPFVLRRTKAEVLKDLPERTEINLYVDLSAEERTRYDEMRLAAVGELDQVVGATESNDQRFRVLAMLTRLRQIACHVGLVDETWKGESAKLVMLMEKVKELKEEGHHVLIFSQFTKYLGLIREAMIESEISLEYLDGKTPAKARQECVDRFQKGETDAFLISLKAGGTGLNLTAADYVIHMDPWWNPAVEDQATDRSHRIGQTRPVIMYRIIAKGTIEDQILSLHADKRDLVSGVMEGTQKAGNMSTTDLLDLIRGTGK